MNKCTVLVFALMGLAIFSCAGLFAEEPVHAPGVTAPPVSEWYTIETGYFTVYYRPGTDLYKIESALKKRVAYFSAGMPAEDAHVTDKIRYQLDLLFSRVEEILDMHPRGMRVTIKIFPTRLELGEEYFTIFKAREDHKSFYINKFNTIYASAEDLSDSVLAHEMAHAVVDRYFAVIPPEKVREMLASYVDLHLAE